MTEELERAKAADLVTLPRAVIGTNCANCTFVARDRDFCEHPQVRQALTDGRERMCCKFWDAPGTKREWE